MPRPTFPRGPAAAQTWARLTSSPFCFPFSILYISFAPTCAWGRHIYVGVYIIGRSASSFRGVRLIRRARKSNYAPLILGRDVARWQRCYFDRRPVRIHLATRFTARKEREREKPFERGTRLRVTSEVKRRRN